MSRLHIPRRLMCLGLANNHIENLMYNMLIVLPNYVY